MRGRDFFLSENSRGQRSILWVHASAGGSQELDLYSLLGRLDEFWCGAVFLPVLLEI